MAKYNAFLVMVKTNYNRILGFFVPHKFRFKLPSHAKPLEEKHQLLFYFSSDGAL